MAYRFLLEVPETLADEAGGAVGAAGDAQVVVRRSKSHSLAYDDPYVDMTVAAHSLGVVNAIYAWFEGFRPAPPQIGIVLHSGERVQLSAETRQSLTAAIRRDQPWVERTAPRIGDHEEDYGSTGTAASVRAPMAGGTTTLDPVTRSLVSNRAVTIRAINHLAIRVISLSRAEKFYADLFALDVILRTQITPDGPLNLPSDFSWQDQPEYAADVIFMQNGPLTLALHRVGLGARIERGVMEHISLRLDASSYTRIRGQALMRGWEIVAQSETDFSFRDPFQIVWDIDLEGHSPFTSAFN